MQDYIYSVIAFLAMVIHLIINSHVIVGRRLPNARGVHEYRGFLTGIFNYYIIDACWGVFAGLEWPTFLYVDTALYYIAIALSVLMWCRFVITYLSLSRWSARMLSWFGRALLAMYVVLLVVNVFNNCLFFFEANTGAYHAGPLRLFLFYPLVALNVLMALFALGEVFTSWDAARKRNVVVLLFCLTMAAAIVLQILWPLWPFYALGCLVGNCFFHIFVIEDVRADLQQAVIEHEQTAKHMAELESALNRARKAEKARSMFFSIVSHDIRTPLNAILGYSELLQFGVKSQAEREEALQSIRASGTTLLQLVNDVLDLAKMDSGKMTLNPGPLRLAQLTDDVFSSFRMAAAEKGLELVNRTSKVPTVMLDEHRFRQILFNLIGNAVKFTARGSVTVDASYAEGTLEVSVTDTGCGIPSNMLTRILDPFVQVQDPSHTAERGGGTGLGLSICRSLVEVMGGKLIVDSELGKGSTFKARIPHVETAADEPAKAAAAEPEPTAASENRPQHVLVVDDSPVNRSVLTAFLKKAGITSIDHACDGAEALAEIKAAAEGDRAYDFVLSDLWMPNMNGLEFIDKLRADPRFKRLPVFAVTADTEFHRDTRTILFTGILLKPMTYAKLMEAFSATADL